MRKRIEAALGAVKAELVFKNAAVVNVFTHQMEECDVAVSQGRVVGLGVYHGEREVDAKGKYLLPGLIDSHIHIESTMLTPAQFARVMLPRGVTGVVADPHEIVNVCGEAGLQFMLDSARGVPLDVWYMLPSCVPATPFDSSGCTLDAAQSRRLMETYGLTGLGEMMNLPGVLSGDGEVLDKIAAARIVDGHAPLVRGKELNAYLSAGVSTDHESVSAEEAREKIARGMYVHIREGTGAHDLDALLPAADVHTQHRMTFCTDDKHIDELMREGTLTHCIAMAVERGMDPADAVAMASLHTTQCYGLTGRGAVAPGYYADLLLCADPCAQEILEVYKDGVLAAKDGRALFDAPEADISRVTDTVRLAPLTADDLRLDFDPALPVIGLNPGSLITDKCYAPTAEGLTLCASIERHHATGRVGRAYVRGLGITGGAVAQSIGHDAHNITVAGDNPEDMLLAVQALGTGGGVCVAAGSKVAALLPLNVAGLMSDRPAEEVLANYRAVSAAMADLCVGEDPSRLMILAFLSLLVIPSLKLSDRGLFDVNEQRFLTGENV